jgi:chromosome segregation ATPase
MQEYVSNYVRENKYFKKLESLLQKIDGFIGKLKNEIKKFNYLTVSIENYRNANKLGKEEKEKIDEIKEMLIEHEDKNSKLLNELKQISSLMQSQFNFIDKSIKKLDNKIMDKSEEQVRVLNKTENKNQTAAGTSKDQSENLEGNYNTILNEIKLMQIKIENIDKKLEKIEKRDEKHRKKETKTEIQTENKDLTQVESKYLNIHKT